MSPFPPPEFIGLLLALAIGFLIGVERGWRQREEADGERVAGIRTFSLIGLLGGLIGIHATGPLSLLALLVAAGTIAALLLGYHADMRRAHNVSATSTLAAVATLGLGAVATAGDMALASVGAGAMVILLASRDALHKAILLTSAGDMTALLRLVLVAFIVLPLLPDVGMGPFEALNPRRLWLVVVVIGAISFGGYVLSRWLGAQRGALITAALGAIVSSTAVTVASARRLREGGGRAEEAAVGLASVVMLARSLLLVGLLAPFAFGAMGLLLLPALVVAAGALAILLLGMRGKSAAEPPKPPSPPSLLIAFVFAGLVAGLTLASAWAQASIGDAAGATVIALGGMVDVDAAIATVGTLPPHSLPLREVAAALAAPVLFNSLFKMALLVGIAGFEASRRAALALAATAVALAAPILLWLLALI